MSRALIFDCDGVLADTERYGHLPAFNQTFEEFGLPVRWSEQDYGPAPVALFGVGAAGCGLLIAFGSDSSSGCRSPG